jgi:uncharacterized membrane protein YphA (DoxX/SURF4 family)
MTDKTRNVITWIVSALLGVGFFLSGAAKFMQAEAAAESFKNFGLPTGMVPFIGICEIAGGIGVLVPRLAGFAALGLLLIMIGAVYNHLTHDPFSKAIPALVMACMAGYVMTNRGLKLASNGGA